MSNYGEIRVTPDELEKTATLILNRAQTYETLYTALLQDVEAIQWKDQAGIAFINKAKGFTDDFQKMKEHMEKYAQVLKKNAHAYREWLDEQKRLADQQPS